MWKKFYDLAQMVFTFGQQTQRNQSSIETLQQEVKQLTGAVQRMAYEIQRLRDDFDHFKDMTLTTSRIMSGTSGKSRPCGWKTRC